MENLIRKIIKKMHYLSDDEKVEAINNIKIALHEISPLKNEPVDCVLWVKNNLVEANDYNPNTVASPEMDLLKLSILNDGYTQPIVVFDDLDKFTVIDGFHRNRVGKEVKEVQDRIKSYLPITIIRNDREDRGDRIAATIRHNRARGKHTIDGMSDIVLELKRRNWSDEKIGRQLGMDADEVLRLCQITGLAEMFNDKEFNKAWEAEIITDEDNLEIDQEHPELKGGV